MMQIDIETAYAEATTALGEAMIGQRLAAKALVHAESTIAEQVAQVEALQAIIAERDTRDARDDDDPTAGALLTV